MATLGHDRKKSLMKRKKGEAGRYLKLDLSQELDIKYSYV